MSGLGKKLQRCILLGAEILENGVDFRVWAPHHKRVRVALEGGPGCGSSGELEREEGGYFSGFVSAVGEGILYRFQLDESDELLPDPASRFQPQGPAGPSQVINPRFAWTDSAWRGVRIQGQIVYEMHIGTFTPEGTWESAEKELAALAQTGITLLEVMPVAEFHGGFGWGYDGVNLYAPTHLYGTPDDFRRFVERAHQLEMGVILDVVYNHLGYGDTLSKFAPAYFSREKNTEWGQAVNFDGEESGPVREFFINNAAYWIEEFHLDGLRLDATHSIFDTSPEHIIAAITRKVRETAGERETVIIAENESQNARLMEPVESGGYGCDALWNDDFHHAAMVALTGHDEAYYKGYLGMPQEFISCIKRGYLYQGQYSVLQKTRRGTPALDTEPARFVQFLQNHDQIAYSAFGQRYHYLTSPGRYKAMTALLMLAPQTPMLFQGQEFAASSPFLYFCDMPDEIKSQVREGRFKLLGQFTSLAQQQAQAYLADPANIDTFNRCKLDFAEREKHTTDYRLYCDLIQLRQKDPVFSIQRRGGVDGTVLGTQAFLLRYFGDNGDDRLVLFNFGRALDLIPAPEPLLAPPGGRHWKLTWSSEEPVYGGPGTLPPEDANGSWHLTGEAAMVLKAAVKESQGQRDLIRAFSRDYG